MTTNTTSSYGVTKYWPYYISNGRFSTDGPADRAAPLVPALYLSPNIKITGGDGTQSNPYTIE